MHPPQYTITRLKEDNVGKSKKPSYSLIQQPEVHVPSSDKEPVSHDEPAVKSFAEHRVIKHPQTSFIKRLWTSLFGGHSVAHTVTQEPGKKHHRAQNQGKHASSKSSGGDKRQQGSNANRRRRSGGGQQRSSSGNTNAAASTHQQRKKPNANQQSHGGSQGNRSIPAKNEGNKKREAILAKEQEEK